MDGTKTTVPDENQRIQELLRCVAAYYRGRNSISSTVIANIELESGGYYLVMASGACTVHTGSHPMAACKFSGSIDNLIAILRRQENPVDDMLNADISVAGDLQVFLELREWFDLSQVPEVELTAYSHFHRENTGAGFRLWLTFGAYVMAGFLALTGSVTAVMIILMGAFTTALIYQLVKKQSIRFEVTNIVVLATNVLAYLGIHGMHTPTIAMLFQHTMTTMMLFLGTGIASGKSFTLHYYRGSIGGLQLDEEINNRVFLKIAVLWYLTAFLAATSEIAMRYFMVGDGWRIMAGTIFVLAETALLYVMQRKSLRISRSLTQSCSIDQKGLATYLSWLLLPGSLDHRIEIRNDEESWMYDISGDQVFPSESGSAAELVFFGSPGLFLQLIRRLSDPLEAYRAGEYELKGSLTALIQVLNLFNAKVPLPRENVDSLKRKPLGLPRGVSFNLMLMIYPIMYVDLMFHIPHWQLGLAAALFGISFLVHLMMDSVDRFETTAVLSLLVYLMVRTTAFTALYPVFAIILGIAGLCFITSLLGSRTVLMKYNSVHYDNEVLTTRSIRHRLYQGTLGLAMLFTYWVLSLDPAYARGISGSLFLPVHIFIVILGLMFAGQLVISGIPEPDMNTSEL